MAPIAKEGVHHMPQLTFTPSPSATALKFTQIILSVAEPVFLIFNLVSSLLVNFHNTMHWDHLLVSIIVLYIFVLLLYSLVIFFHTVRFIYSFIHSVLFYLLIARHFVGTEVQIWIGQAFLSPGLTWHTKGICRIQNSGSKGFQSDIYICI